MGSSDAGLCGGLVLVPSLDLVRGHVEFDVGALDDSEVVLD